MLVLVRLIPKGGPKHLMEVIEKEKRNLFFEDVEPVYALRQEGRREVGMVLNVKKLDSVMKVFLASIHTMTSVRRIQTIPLMSPLYFPLPDKHPENMQRHLVYLRVSPDRYRSVYEAIVGLKPSKDTFITYMSYSFGDDDIIVSLLSTDREACQKFVKGRIARIKGVMAWDTSKIIESVPMLSISKMRSHKNRFMHTTPTGQKGEREYPEVFERYRKENTPTCVMVRLFAEQRLAKEWQAIKENLPKTDGESVTPVFASLQEAKPFISVMFEVRNFEALSDYLVGDFGAHMKVKKTRTIPLIEPTYFLMPKDHPTDLDRFLVTIRVDPSRYMTVRSQIMSYNFPDDVYMTYLTYSLGEDDLFLSILCSGPNCANKFAREAFDDMPGVRAYEVSNQLMTTRLTTKSRWKNHQTRFLSSYDKQHKKDYDKDFDWTESPYKYDLMGGAGHRDMED